MTAYLCEYDAGAGTSVSGVKWKCESESQFFSNRESGSESMWAHICECVHEGE